LAVNADTRSDAGCGLDAYCLSGGDGSKHAGWYLGMGILLTVFPMAHGAILVALNLPFAFMLLGLTLAVCHLTFA